MPGSCAALVSGLLFVKIGVRTGRDWHVPGLESPGVQGPEGSPLLHAGGLWALTQAGGGTSYHRTISKVVPTLQAAAGSVIPQLQSLPPVPEASSTVVKVVAALGQGSLVPTHALISWSLQDELGIK